MLSKYMNFYRLESYILVRKLHAWKGKFILKISLIPFLPASEINCVDIRKCNIAKRVREMLSEIMSGMIVHSKNEKPAQPSAKSLRQNLENPSLV